MSTSTRRRALAVLALPVAGALAVAACGGDDEAGGGSPSPASDTSAGAGSEAGDPSPPATSEEASDTAAPEVAGEILVSAAASLTESFTLLGEQFEATYPGTRVTFTFDSSSTLAEQLLAGAPADVYASADEANMTKLADAGVVDSPDVFATNSLVIVTKPGNPSGVAGLADLASVGVVSLCGAEVPCGRFAQQVLDGAGVAIPETSVTRGQNVKATLQAVAEGDAVAGIVYVTDAATAGGAVTTVEIPAEQNAVATYPVDVVGATQEADVAEAFVDLVLSPEGQEALAGFGFAPPA